jgi:hypothetical protein
VLAIVVCVKEWHHVHVKAGCTLMKLGSGSGSQLSPSSLLPHQCTTHKCLAFSPTTQPTFLTWPKRNVTGVMALTIRVGYHYYTFQKHHVISLHFLRNGSEGRSLLLYIPKTSIYFHYFSQKRSFHEYCESGPRILNDWRRKMTLRETIDPI